MGNREMDVISQLQEQVNTIASIAFNTFGTLQRDAPSVRLSASYPEPPPNDAEDAATFAEQPKLMSSDLVKAAKQQNVGRRGILETLPYQYILASKNDEPSL